MSKKAMLILGIESSCDDSCVALFDAADNKILGHCVLNKIEEFRDFGGIVPELASRQHVTALPLALTKILQESQISLSDVDLIAVTTHPGLMGSLIIGTTFAKSLSYIYKIPLVSLNHLECHLYSPLLSRTDSAVSEVPAYPWLTCVVSGGHTEVYHVEAFMKHERVAMTRDDAAGEAFDKMGKMLGLSYPAGPVIDKVAGEYLKVHGEACIKNNPFRGALLDDQSFSFSGLKTSVRNSINRQNDNMSDEAKAYLVTLVQEAIIEQLTGRVDKLKERYPKAQVLYTGGVACNSRLRLKSQPAFFPPRYLCTDNALMVCQLAAEMWKKQKLTYANEYLIPLPTKGVKHQQ